MFDFGCTSRFQVLLLPPGRCRSFADGSGQRDHRMVWIQIFPIIREPGSIGSYLHSDGVDADLD